MGMKFLEWRFQSSKKYETTFEIFSNINGWSENFVTLVTESKDTCILASYISN